MTIKNAKAKGTRNEHRSKALLEAAGYAVCRAATSLGVWDLVGMALPGNSLISPSCPVIQNPARQFHPARSSRVRQ